MADNATTMASMAGASAPVCPSILGEKVDVWAQPLVVAPTAFHFKSLCDFTANPFVGCGHGCAFCYVPAVSAGKQKHALAKHGVQEPDLDWGNYALLRQWDEEAFRTSVRTAARTPAYKLMPGGNRAVMYSSTTDPYQHIRHADDARRQELNEYRQYMIRRSLEIIRDESDLRVRIQTRFVTPEMDFDLYRTLGRRLILGTSVMSLDPSIQKVYEPKVPPAERRLEMLRRAGESGIAVYVAVAPVPPEADEADLKRTLEAVKAVNPLTVFLEPINRRGKNFTRIAEAARRVGVTLKPETGSTKGQRAYAMQVFGMAEELAREIGLHERLHLWPDKELGTPAAFREVPDPSAHLEWLQRWWNKVSEWPGDAGEATGLTADHPRVSAP